METHNNNFFACFRWTNWPNVQIGNMWRTWKPFISVASLTSSKPSITKWTSVLALSSLKRLLFQWPLPPIWWDIWVKNQSSGLGQLLEPHPQLPHLHYSHFWACHYVHYKYFSHSVTLQTSQCHFEQFFSDHDSYLFIQFPNFDSVLKLVQFSESTWIFFGHVIFLKVSVQFFGGPWNWANLAWCFKIYIRTFKIDSLYTSDWKWTAISAPSQQATVSPLQLPGYL